MQNGNFLSGIVCRLRLIASKALFHIEFHCDFCGRLTPDPIGRFLSNSCGISSYDGFKAIEIFCREGKQVEIVIDSFVAYPTFHSLG